MKKFLSLALALVMTMSLVTISAGAKDFTDDSKIAYKEAVDVMSSVKVIDGYTDGAFNPANTLTRGAAAKIICNMILGPTTAGTLTADAAPFKDVPANHTFAGYIAYCAKQGIISGYADGSFRPAGTVTGYQFMKMLLGALGYDAATEGFTGANWSINVAKLASSLSLDKGNSDFVGTKAMTREEACLYAFNTMKATMVEYSNNASDITIGGVTISQGKGKATEMVNNNTKTIKNDGLMQFAEKYFKDLKLTAGSTDAFNRPANTWNFKTNEVGTYAKSADASYTAEVKLGTIYTELGLGKGLAAANVEFTRNGNVETSAMSTTTITKGSDTKIGGNGVLTEVYYDADNGTAVVTMVDTYYGEVTAKRDATAAKDAYVTVSGSGKSGNFETTDFAVEDLVAFTYSDKSGEGVKSVAKAETVVGTLTAYTAEKSVTVAGTTYKFNDSYKANGTAANLQGSVKYDVKVVLDQYGYVVNVDTKATSTTYAVVLKYKADAGTYGGDAIAKLLFTDGTTKDVTLTAPASLEKGDIVSYRVNNSDKYAVTEVGSVATKSGALVSRNIDSLSNIATSLTANGKTIFLIATKNGDDTVYTAYVGIKNVPSVNAKAAVPVSVVKVVNNGVTSNTADVVYIDATANTDITSSSKDVIFVKGSNAGQAYDSVKGYYYTYDAVVNGEITKIETVTGVAKNADTMFTSSSKDKNGIMTLSGSSNADVFGNGGALKGTVKAANGVIGLGGNFYSYSDDCKVFMIDNDGNINASSVTAIATTSGATADTVFFKKTDGDVTTIVIKQHKDSGSGSVGTDTSIDTVTLNDTSKEIKLTLKGNVTANTNYVADLYMFNAATASYVKITSYPLTVAANSNTATATASVMIANVMYYVSINGVNSGLVTAK